MKSWTTEYFDCACHCDEHVVKFQYDAEDNQLYTTIYLSQYHSFFGRLWLAIKYVLGLKPKYGHFDTWIFNIEDAERLQNLLNRVIQDSSKQEGQLTQIVPE